MPFTIKDKTRDRRKCSLFTVEGCSPKTNRVISPTVKYMEKMGPGKSVHYEGVFTNQGCSLSEVSLYTAIFLHHPINTLRLVLISHTIRNV